MNIEHESRVARSLQYVSSDGDERFKCSSYGITCDADQCDVAHCGKVFDRLPHAPVALTKRLICVASVCGAWFTDIKIQRCTLVQFFTGSLSSPPNTESPDAQCTLLHFFIPISSNEVKSLRPAPPFARFTWVVSFSFLSDISGSSRLFPIIVFLRKPVSFAREESRLRWWNHGRGSRHAQLDCS